MAFPLPAPLPPSAPPSFPSFPWPRPPLYDCVIDISGIIHGHTHRSIGHDYITALGGMYNRSLAPRGPHTHLVTTQSDYDRNSTKVKYAKQAKVHIVTFQWLQDSLKNMRRMPESDYPLDAIKFNPVGSISQKRRAIQEPMNNNNDHNRKRLRISTTDTQNQEAESTKSLNSQIARSRDIRVPLDNGADVEKYKGYEVYIDDDGVIYDASLNQTSASNNHNKFYRLQVLRNVKNHFICWTRWGRVGVSGTKKALVNDGSLLHAREEFHTKFLSKTGAFVVESCRSSYTWKYEPDSEDEDDAEDPNDIIVRDKPEVSKSTLSKPVQDLMQLIFNKQYFAATMSEFNYDAVKLPLGKLSKNTINRGFNALKDLSAFLNDSASVSSQYEGDHNSINEELSNRYFSIIPHNFRKDCPPIIRDPTLLKREIELLESLAEMKDASLLMSSANKDETTNILDNQFRSLGMKEITPLSHNSQEFLQLKDYLMESRGIIHKANYEVSQIFRIERPGERDQLQGVCPISLDRKLLWHGSRCTNFGGILSQGLRIAPPDAPRSGYSMSAYLSLCSSSARYCLPRNSNGHALILLCEAELGRPVQELTAGRYQAAEDAIRCGFLSTLGHGRVGPKQWKDAGCIHPSLEGVSMPDTSVKYGLTGIPDAALLHNEYVVYNTAQVRLRYLFRVRM
ncbi:PARP-domain-containing protein [Hypoxylon sp. FL0890]|nr:PARP-domain-containing protein [Hypoxylon sp. FL0890]